MNNKTQIILASASPRRYELLQQIGVTSLVQAVDIDETRRSGESALQYVQRLALEKAQRGQAVIENKQVLPVLGSDTIVVVAGNIFGKPASRQQARLMWQQMSGNKHVVHTSVAVVSRDKTVVDTSSSQVAFNHLSAQEIDTYLETGEADDKAGAYAIQGMAAQFVKNINGSYSGIMGLPLFETAQLLKQCGVDILPPVSKIQA